MPTLAERKCAPSKGNAPPLTRAECKRHLSKLAATWKLSDDSRGLSREFKFVDFYRTMSFVNALAHVANIEDHHPDLEVGYDYCRVKWSTHSIGGLSDNDFICAAKLDRIIL